MRFRRDVVEDVKDTFHDAEDAVVDLEHKAEDALQPVADTLHVPAW